MSLRTTGIVFTVMAMSLAGCVAQSEVDRYQSLHRQAQSDIVDLKMQLDEKDAEIAALRDAQGSAADIQQRLIAAEADAARLREALAAAQAQLEGMAQGPVLPADLNSALAALAAANSDLMSYDPDLGMVRFRSDFTFALGSDAVKPEVVQTLNRLATVLNSPSAQAFEVRIVGHTDTVPISNPATLARHATNRHLSAHRAISVENVLQKAGVNPARMAVVGYGPYRPVVQNTRGGAEPNRRVEIYLVAMTTNDSAAYQRGQSVTETSPVATPVRQAPALQPSNDAAFK